MNAEEYFAMKNKPFQILEGNFGYVLAIPSHINATDIRIRLEREFKDALIDLARDENFGITGVCNSLGLNND